ncbi:uncharacterized protein [Parasteatoda tepidariorum]|uniref:uncharacterized protein isoform X1 n=1 Tax=Parasteatoda tepidariorum TaxID=114398 RepID=UPI00077FE1B9|nr:zinc finger protein 474-like [Parasteatoda tepidariorum]
MRSSDSPYLFCRICGTRYRSDKVDQHEKICLEKSQGKEQTWLEKEAPSNVYLHQALSSMSEAQLNASDEETEEISKSDTDEKSQSTPERPPKLTSLEQLDKDKKEMVETPYPSPSSITNDNQMRTSRVPQRSRPSKKIGENPKQAWNANAKKPLSAKIEMPKSTKKYRHYPVSCEFCNKKFQPAELRKHIRKHHADAHLPIHLRGTDQGKIPPPDKEKSKKKVRKVGDGPRFRICYICGRQFGSKSLPIHEPKCLEKWRIQNGQLPPDKRMPEPIKPKTLSESELDENLHGSEGYSKQLPELNSENEAAYQSHMMNLVPCSYCSRRFNPDRIMIHENACIERPKKREYITPDNVEKK